MIISRTPYRVSLFGGGTDYPEYCQKAEGGGAVIGFALNKYCYLTVRHLPPYFHHKHRIVYSQVEHVNKIADIKHPSVKAVLQTYWGDVDKTGLEIHHDGDVPAMSGLGSSSAFTVGLINAIHALSGQRIKNVDLAASAIHIEQHVIGEAVGSQDQIFAATGGFIRIDFGPTASISQPIIMPSDRRQYLMDRLVLYFTGQQRFASEIAKSVISGISANWTHLRRMRDMVDTAEQELRDGDIDNIGAMLHETWKLKRGLSPVVSSQGIDDMYHDALSAGATGGKLLGAGGGGFMLFYVPPERREAVRKALSYMIEVRPGIDQNGSQIVLYEPDGWT